MNGGKPLLPLCAFMAWMGTALPFFLYIGWYVLIIVAGFGTWRVITSLQCGMRSALWTLVVKREAVPAYQCFAEVLAAVHYKHTGACPVRN